MSFEVRFQNILLLLTVVFCAVTTIRAGWCPDKYERYSLEHSYCLRRCCSCPYYKRGITQGLKDLILGQHNSYRSKVAGGHSYGVGHLSRATNMLEMVWDDELAEIAQKRVDSCQRSPDCDLCRMVDRFAVGQTIVQFIGSEMTHHDYEMEFSTFFSALEHLKKDQVARYTSSAGNSGITQMLWAKTWRIGCGYLYFHDSSQQTKYSLLTCNYGPGGNVEGEEVYKAGSACSACPANSCCGDGCKKHGIKAKYNGLCKVIDENLAPEGNVPHTKSGKEVFYCGFNGESDCNYNIEGIDRWVHNTSTGGTWIRTYLGSRGYTILKFEEPITSKSGKLCLKVVTRSGPTAADQEYKYEMTAKLEEEGKYMTTVAFPRATNKVKHMFHTDYIKPSSFPKNRGVKLTLAFSVPANTPRQYLEIKQIVAEEKDCPRVTTEEGMSFSTSR